ncbi:hypothetical protein [Burkholderia seminalis]|uniref:hypothetical protein n=1 Tax=Burkholderia seminalis TaxID=488731 RepID=UPI0019064E19|nr:hypothetical protein [Burkholderia seminalis]MBJ9965632.1 hypothetical protein [Burkholderia seminalis]MDN7592162.1 hypothetical protein [Burkholderia seminalis]
MQIIEDHPFQLEILAALFSCQPGIKVEACLSAADVAARCLAQSSDLVLMIQFIQFLSGLADPPRLALMSVAEGRILASSKLTAQSPGVNVVAVLRKPVQASEVAALLADLISFPPAPAPTGVPTRRRT